MPKITKEKALAYHVGGKIGIAAKTPFNTEHELSLAYTPGVAYPCLEIEKDPSLSFKYTNRANLVAVISDGSAVLGLGNIGPLAGKPVMEGKSVLFKKFACIDAFDIELDVHSVDEIVAVCRAIAPTFGGINLEDIAVPHCFEIEKKLQEVLDIPVFHDDQHGTAIITTAGLINALKLTGKKAEEIKVVINGAGAAGIASAKMYQALGVRHIIMCDSKGVLSTRRSDLNAYKAAFAIETEASTLEEVIAGADMFLGLSKAGALSKEMVAQMAPEPIIFALANPIPEILPEEVVKVRNDVIMGTGRSDYPNQINNVLGFPFIFRGALDVCAKRITEKMKMAAARALATLAKAPASEDLKAVYPNASLLYGKEYLIPKAFDKEVLAGVASAVARCAVEEGVSSIEHYDHEAYQAQLRAMIYETKGYEKEK
ncbi:malic enzyme-like NAD(P)-binding protein [Sulfurovum sp.]|jgi:malate dehydrogenase (oxaloacetate-decarboxylating)(NADP+)|uniref:malic enzyme-like NAD(P)-binding protein n=1 Tax=Sulfurovum sp. TaxID=1969726 RepID=UPI002A362C20|nr:malic enzyme-like NAD(P)-binding protein [Sulfurovum sp.]MDD3500776.1 malate dehydrogenase [Sulfurovum sp.]MDY0403241.1 malic enzyme-like NAD(P)-binding protein [Sulfurovum sp.]